MGDTSIPNKTKTMFQPNASNVDSDLFPPIEDYNDDPQLPTQPANSTDMNLGIEWPRNNSKPENDIMDLFTKSYSHASCLVEDLKQSYNLSHQRTSNLKIENTLLKDQRSQHRSKISSLQKRAVQHDTSSHEMEENLEKLKKSLFDRDHTIALRDIRI